MSMASDGLGSPGGGAHAHTLSPDAHAHAHAHEASAYANMPSPNNSLGSAPQLMVLDGPPLDFDPPPGAGHLVKCEGGEEGDDSPYTHHLRSHTQHGSAPRFSYQDYQCSSASSTSSGAGMCDGDVVQLWGYEWRRDIGKEGRATLLTSLPSEGEYERFMQRFGGQGDNMEGFYWVTDRGRKYSKAASSLMQRMKWKDTFNCFFGRRHTKREDPKPDPDDLDPSDKRRKRASQKVYCPATLVATCLIDGRVELRYFDKHVEHPTYEGKPKRTRIGATASASTSTSTSTWQGASASPARGPVARRTKLLENEHVSAYRLVLRPGQPTRPTHHPRDRVLYVLQGGRMRVVDESQQVKAVHDLEADKAYWLPRDPPGESRGEVVDGPEPISCVVVEVEGGGLDSQSGPLPPATFPPYVPGV